MFMNCKENTQTYIHFLACIYTLCCCLISKKKKNNTISYPDFCANWRIKKKKTVLIQFYADFPLVMIYLWTNQIHSYAFVRSNIVQIWMQSGWMHELPQITLHLIWPAKYSQILLKKLNSTIWSMFGGQLGHVMIKYPCPLMAIVLIEFVCVLKPCFN